MLCGEESKGRQIVDGQPRAHDQSSPNFSGTDWSLFTSST